jgi:hypothetical protein
MNVHFRRTERLITVFARTPPPPHICTFSGPVSLLYGPLILILILSSCRHPRLSTELFLLSFPKSLPYDFVIAPAHATCRTHLTKNGPTNYEAPYYAIVPPSGHHLKSNYPLKCAFVVLLLTKQKERFTFTLPSFLTASFVLWSEFMPRDPEVRVLFPAVSDSLRSSGFGKGCTQPRE